MLLLLACAPDPDASPASIRTVDGDTLTLSEPGVGAITLTARAVGEGDLSVTLEDGGDHVGIVVSGTGTLHAIVLEGPWSVEGSDDAVLWRQGYQSWSWSGVLELEEPTLDANAIPTAAGDGDVITIASETPWSSWWGGLAGKDGGGAVLLGAMGATRTKFYTAWSPTQAWAVWGNRGEAIPVDGTLELDPLFVGLGDETLWDDWAAAVPARTPAEAPPVGWSDWYVYYGQATEADLRGQLALAAPPLEVFQVDDGWERAWGDWTWRDTFPTGATLAADIAARGLVPGLWMAPLYVSRDTETYTANPDWWVRDAAGDELRHGQAAGLDLAVLDVTHPDAADWLRGVMADRRAEGWRYFKLDFLYAGAVEGVRAEDVTGAEAYARAMALLREALGDDPFLACGAPMLPSVGWADLWRSGPDIAYANAPDPERAFLRAQGRSTAARQFANGVWWWNDPDGVLVRGWDATALSGALAAQVASGGTWFLGDRLDDPNAAAVLDAALVARRGEALRPEHPLAFVSGIDPTPLYELGVPDDAVPERWLGEHTSVAMNLGEREVTASVEGTLLVGDGDGVLAPGEGEVRGGE